MNLQELWQSKGFHYYPTDKGKEHSYLEVYSELFQKFKDEEINIIEIGIYLGGSMRLFSDWFSKANIRGYDVTDEFIRVPLGRGKKIIKNCREFTIDEFKDFSPHIIIDDASHLVEDQIKMVEICYPQLEKGGYLIIEDVQEIQYNKIKFDQLGIPYKLYDLRLNKGRYDDILIVYKK